jgi:hypothetical protein
VQWLTRNVQSVLGGSPTYVFQPRPLRSRITSSCSKIHSRQRAKLHAREHGDPCLTTHSTTEVTLLRASGMPLVLFPAYSSRGCSAGPWIEPLRLITRFTICTAGQRFKSLSAMGFILMRCQKHALRLCRMARQFRRHDAMFWQYRGV